GPRRTAPAGVPGLEGRTEAPEALLVLEPGNTRLFTYRTPPGHQAARRVRPGTGHGRVRPGRLSKGEPGEDSVPRHCCPPPVPCRGHAFVTSFVLLSKSLRLPHAEDHSGLNASPEGPGAWKGAEADVSPQHAPARSVGLGG